MRRRGAGWYDAGDLAAAGLGADCALGIEFSKAMENESLRSAFRLEPSLAGHVEVPSDRTAVFVPDKGPAPETGYTLTVPAESRDASGKKMGEDSVTHFRSDLPYLKLISVNAYENSNAVTHIDGPENHGEHRVLITPGLSSVHVELRFSLPFSAEEKAAAALAVTLTAFFPLKLPVPAVEDAKWLSADTLLVTWNGVNGGSDSEPHYYKPATFCAKRRLRFRPGTRGPAISPRRPR